MKPSQTSLIRIVIWYPISKTRVLLPISTCVVTGLVRASTILIKAVVLADVRHMCGTMPISLVLLTGSSVVPKSIKPVDLGCAEFSTFSDVLAALCIRIP